MNDAIAEIMSLKNHIALVTGGSQGIGEKTAKILAESGAEVVICSRSEDRLKAAQKRLAAQGQHVHTVLCDIKNPGSIALMVQEIEEHIGPISILVNNAGVDIPMAALDVTEETWTTIMDTNVKGVFFCAQQVARFMIPRNQGVIINLASELSFVGMVPYAVYAISKGAVVQLTKTLALEWAPHHIRVNAIAPTLVETPMLDALFSHPEHAMRQWINMIPLGRLGTPTDVAHAIAFLASDAASFITGTILPVDGGRLCH
ncbi:SDR family NAD(P)-dependent oxidoreductase [Sulfobacillus thermosulfidooxidans]|uniref:SDR family NAD(P)-dependent oxidoreductase n=1 Tax=Sulfobacillus thermosulfidooxidans TaxID=28034 RepID=UPI0006B5873B|nr:SDR family oxidoreductase [Sulfobacillus thermosulfidooxidans]